VTDANLLLGYLNPDYFLGGRMKLDRASAERAIAEQVGAPLGLDLDRAAWGVHQIANVNMERAIRSVSVERGIDPRDLTLVAFGGAGPLHAARLGRALGIRKASLPAAAGVTSAIGLLIADVRFDLARTRITRLAALDAALLERVYADLEREAAALLGEAGLEGEQVLEYAADMRFVGQGYEIEVPLPARPWDGGDAAELIRAAHRARYADVYGYAESIGEPEVITFKLRAARAAPRIDLPRQEPGPPGSPTPRAIRPAYFPEAGGWVERCPVYDRAALRPGATLAGPAVIEEEGSTTILLPGDHATVDPYASLLVTLGASA
jgi:N-methylhydantoinase A/oxoprolinase/acetone carboxylase beta subunit